MSKTYAVTHSVDLERQHRRKQMGRPLNKRFFGDPATADQRAAGSETQENIRVEAHVGGSGDAAAYIVNQKGSNKFTVSNNAGTATAVCRLVDKAFSALAAGEMVLFGAVDGGESRVTLKKITGRKCSDYNGNQYTWSVEDDSTETIIRLVAI